MEIHSNLKFKLAYIPESVYQLPAWLALLILPFLDIVEPILTSRSKCYLAQLQILLAADSVTVHICKNFLSVEESDIASLGTLNIIQ